MCMSHILRYSQGNQIFHYQPNKFLQMPQVLEEFLGTVSKRNKLQERATGFVYYKECYN